MIHLDFLIEDTSGKVMLEEMLPKILPDDITYNIYSYKGIGHVPGRMRSAKAIKNKQLMDNLPKLLNGFGKTYKGWGDSYKGHVILVCDLDDNNFEDFLEQLNKILSWCQIKPQTSFCLAIEEGEAWLLGDKNAVLQAYPHADKVVLDNYKPDSICGTWEKLAIALGYNYKNKSYQEVGQKKYEWAQNITPYIDVTRNTSPSFQHFIHELTRILAEE